MKGKGIYYLFSFLFFKFIKMIYKIKRFSKGIVSPIVLPGKYKGGNRNLLNLAEDFLERKQNKRDYLLKLGTQEIMGSGMQHTSRFSNPVKVGRIIEGFGKYSYKNGKKLNR